MSLKTTSAFSFAMSLEAEAGGASGRARPRGARGPCGRPRRRRRGSREAGRVSRRCRGGPRRSLPAGGRTARCAASSPASGNREVGERSRDGAGAARVEVADAVDDRERLRVRLRGEEQRAGLFHDGLHRRGNARAARPPSAASSAARTAASSPGSHWTKTSAKSQTSPRRGLTTMSCASLRTTASLTRRAATLWLDSRSSPTTRIVFDFGDARACRREHLAAEGAAEAAATARATGPALESMLFGADDGAGDLAEQVVLFVGGAGASRGSRCSRGRALRGPARGGRR